MTTRRSGFRRVGALVAVGLLAGCGSGATDPGASPTPPAGTPSPIAAIDASMLLPAAGMPPWNGAIVWREADQDDLAVPSPACSLPAPQALVAVTSFTASYTADAAMTGSNTIMLFPDEAAALAAVEGP